MNSLSIDCKLDAESFEAISALAYKECGLQLVSEKARMLQSRLRCRLNELGMRHFRAYARYITAPEGMAERREMISALTTNVSHFFREKHHFDRLAQVILPEISSKILSGQKIRIWSAGCSNGQEPYSIAMTLMEVFPRIFEHDVRILATDIDPKVVKFAQVGRFPDKMLTGMAPNLFEKYFLIEEDGQDIVFSPRGELTSLIRFKELNLLANWPMRGQFDLIFCRNVVIYFDLKTQNQLWPRFNQALKPGGRLFLGHSERITEPAAYGFISDGPTIYAKPVVSPNCVQATEERN